MTAPPSCGSLFAVPGIDLHAHTNRSDGTFTPREVVELAARRGLSVLAVTDHDTTEGLAEAAAAAGEAGIELVPGLELSSMYEGSSIHVLAYWIRVDDRELQVELSRLRDDRLRRGERMVEKLQALGYPISFERVREIAGEASIVRPHVAQALVEAGVVATEHDAYTSELIADGGRADEPKHALHPLDALALIRRAGGVSVLAHPGMWGDQREVPGELIQAMAAAGMEGLETDHPDHTPEQRIRYAEVAGALGLLATGSSDCHGTRYDPVRLGTVTTDPLSFAALRERAGAR
ncbi:MAG: PHP domain-containing protein [Actinobacteria bacterium]|nr:PHP domain-containing protein [Actinomycetota bacterium]